MSHGGKICNIVQLKFLKEREKGYGTCKILRDTGQ